MRTHITASCLLLACLTASYGQKKFHSPAELFKLVEDSRLTYQIASYDSSEETDRSSNSSLLNSHNQHIVLVDGAPTVTMYELSVDGMKAKEAAEAQYDKRDLEAARREYVKLLKIHPEYAPAMTYIGQTYVQQGDMAQAEHWLLQAIDSNFYDYLAHVLLTDVYLQKELKDSAIYEMAIALVLNPQFPGLQDKAKTVFAAAGRDYHVWRFNPGVRLGKQIENKVPISFRKNDLKTWVSYGLCKALWAAEPGYREMMMERRHDFPEMVEEEESLRALAVSYLNLREDDKIPKNEVLESLVTAIKQGMIQLFAVYEIFLQDNPRIAYTIPPKDIVVLASYVTTTHAPQH